MKRLRFILIIAAIVLIFVPQTYAGSLVSDRLKNTSEVMVIERTAMTLPASTQSSVFKIAGDPITVLGITGEVTTLIGSVSTGITLIADPTTPSTDTNLTTGVEITDDAAGTYYSLVTSVATALAVYTNGAGPTMSGVFGLTVPVGNIDLYAAGAGTNTGAITWRMYYRPGTDSVVTAE